MKNKTAKEIFTEVYEANFGKDDMEITNQLSTALEHDYIFEAMEAYANQFKDSKWISVEEGLPEKDMVCLLKCEGRKTEVTTYSFELKIFGLLYNSTKLKATHWMEIPEPPELT